MLHTVYYASPLGEIELTASDDALLAVHFAEAEKVSAPRRPATAAPSAILAQATTELAEYFAGDRQVFSVPVAPQGTAFQQRVWAQLAQITYGSTCSYAEIADRLGDPKVIRAAASANGKNPISIIIPCHRVIGADGKMVGYGGDVWRKVWLLKHELPQSPSANTLF